MLTGDRPAPAKQIGAVLGLDEVRTQQTPVDKVAGVRAERQRAVTAMVGDGEARGGSSSRIGATKLEPRPTTLTT